MIAMRRVILVMVALAALAGCGAGPTEPQPPKIAYGRDTSDNMCGMIISEPRFASASVLTDGANRKFDDIAEMVMYHLDRPNEKVAAYFVHDFNTEAWTRAEQATYVQSTRIRSPMDRQLAAFENKDEAAAYAEKVQGTVMGFDRMRLWVHENLHH